MRYEKIAVYNYEELNDTAKEKVLQGFRNDPWFEPDLYYYAEKLAEIGFTDAEIEYSGFCSQGDGASFTSRIDIEKIFSTLVYCNKCRYDNFYKFLKMSDIGMIEFDLYVRRGNNYRYYHEKTCYVDGSIHIYPPNDKACSERLWSWFEAIEEEIKSDIEDLRFKISIVPMDLPSPGKRI